MRRFSGKRPLRALRSPRCNYTQSIALAAPRALLPCFAPRSPHPKGALMADIELRFHKDMLVLSAPLAFALANQGVDMETEAEYMSLVEPETMRDALRLESMAGAQCLVAETDICEARLAHKRMEDRARELAQAAISHARANAPQHVLCEVGPCGLPLDATSAMSMKQCAAQYEDAARALVEGGKEAMGSLAESEGAGFDAIFLNGLRSAADVQCGIEGVRRAYTGPVFASVDVNEQGEFDGKPLAEAIEVLAKADVIGIRCCARGDCGSGARDCRRHAEAYFGAGERAPGNRRREAPRIARRAYSREPLCVARLHGRCGCGSARSGRSVPARVRRGDSCIHGRFGRRRFRRRQHSLIVCRQAYRDVLNARSI